MPLPGDPLAIIIAPTGPQKASTPMLSIILVLALVNHNPTRMLPLHASMSIKCPFSELAIERPPICPRLVAMSMCQAIQPMAHYGIVGAPVMPKSMEFVVFRTHLSSVAGIFRDHFLVTWVRDIYKLLLQHATASTRMTDVGGSLLALTRSDRTSAIENSVPSPLFFGLNCRGKQELAVQELAVSLPSKESAGLTVAALGRLLLISEKWTVPVQGG
eukprot:CAMPEP_0172721942 /NCGR_PEP_ID=MMETSP1074-20121228/80241_1 /TAXON_ID=2916 /ORGANISM="Ceratium fusus, Strain PA161109" /LENGTH=215 /DNA_ID=CAMNT_0013547813 /DNA_START=256 /DNA_END=904 /DNA_ORIENTATION=-